MLLRRDFDQMHTYVPLDFIALFEQRTKYVTEDFL